MERQAQALEKFFKSIFIGESSLEKIVLKQIIQGVGDNILRTYQIDSPQYDSEECERMIAEILEIAQEDANGQNIVGTYCVVAYSDKSVIGRSPLFRIRPDSQENPLGDSEPATNTGLLAQVMRHNEALMRGMTQMFQAVSSSNASTIERLSMANERLQADRIEAFGILEEAYSEKHTRELEAKKLAQKNKVQEQIVEKITPLIPVLVAKLTGKTPSGDSPEGLLIKSILEDLTPDQIQKIADILGPKALPLMDFYVSMKNKESNGAPS